jgi:hypothetical protein
VAIEKLEGWGQLQETMLSTADRRRLCASYGRFARRLHDAGIWQYDFNPHEHPGEGRRAAADRFRRMKLYDGPVPASERWQSLAKMNRIASISRADRLRFLKSYLGSVAAELKNWKAAAKEILAGAYAAQVRATTSTAPSGGAGREPRPSALVRGTGSGAVTTGRSGRHSAGGLTLDEVRVARREEPDDLSFRVDGRRHPRVAEGEPVRPCEGGPAPIGGRS